MKHEAPRRESVSSFMLLLPSSAHIFSSTSCFGMLSLKCSRNIFIFYINRNFILDLKVPVTGPFSVPHLFISGPYTLFLPVGMASRLLK
jgi:hypothetical protein